MSKKYIPLTNKEYEIMKALWKVNKPMLFSEIVKQANVSKNSCLSAISVLVDKSYVSVSESTCAARTSDMLFAPKITSSEYLALIMVKIFKENKKSVSLTMVLTHFVDYSSKKDREKLWAEIDEMVNQRKGSIYRNMLIFD